MKKIKLKIVTRKLLDTTMARRFKKLKNYHFNLIKDQAFSKNDLSTALPIS